MNSYNNNNFNNTSNTNKYVQKINSLFAPKNETFQNNNNFSNPFNMGNNKNSNNYLNFNNHFNFLNNQENQYNNFMNNHNPINNIPSNRNNNRDDDILKLNLNINNELMVQKVSLDNNIDIGQSPILGEEQNSNFIGQNSNDYILIEQLQENKNSLVKDNSQNVPKNKNDYKFNNIYEINKNNIENINNFNINNNENNMNNMLSQNKINFNTIKINLNKENIMPINKFNINLNNNDKYIDSNINNNKESEKGNKSISEDITNKLEKIELNKIEPDWFKNENNYQDPLYFEKLKQYELNRMGIKPLKLSDFLIGKKLGSGQFGKVYLAKYIPTEFICAIKVLNKKSLLKQNLKTINQVRREIEIQSHLHHPNILSIYNFFWDQKNIYLVIEYATGGELFKILQKEENGRFSEPKAAFYIKQVCDAIEYIHKMHIIHRDIKPENILLCNEEIKLADFGWSIHQRSNKLRKTFCGTIEYIPPEVIEGQPHIPSSDLWCLGILIYELCAGVPPFTAKTHREIISKIRKFNMKKYPDFFSNEVKDLIEKLLKKSAEDRITIKEVKNHPWIVNNSKKYIYK